VGHVKGRGYRRGHRPHASYGRHDFRHERRLSTHRKHAVRKHYKHGHLPHVHTVTNSIGVGHVKAVSNRPGHRHLR
jgi:hypothetical protein